MWCSASEFTDLDKKTRSHAWREIFSSAYITTALNPKSIVFFLAFIPQFIEPELPFTTQAVILGATFFVLAIISVLGYAARTTVTSTFNPALDTPNRRRIADWCRWYYCCHLMKLSFIH